MKIIGILVVLLTLTLGAASQTYDRAKIWDAEINAIADFDLRQKKKKNVNS